MKRFFHKTAFLLAVWATVALAAPRAFAMNPVPVAPIAPVPFSGWTNAYRLHNEVLSVIVVPEFGRIAYLAWEGESNLLRLNEAYLGQTADDIESDDWLNFGGDWVWPVAQSRWPEFQDVAWPPSRLLDGRAWTGRAWRTEAGTTHALLTQDFGDPIHARVTRTMRLDATRPQLTIRQHVERLAPSDIPLTLWQLLQLDAAEYLVIPVDATSRFPDGYTPLLFDLPPAAARHPCPGVLVYDPRHGGEHKLGSDATRHWAAAVVGDTVLLMQAETDDTEGTYPDGGCRVQIYSNHDLGYAELEVLSTEQALAMEDIAAITVRIELHRIDPVPTTPCEWGKAVQRLLGEDPDPAETATEEEIQTDAPPTRNE